MTKYTLFVYGTLKRNFHNHYLLKTSQYLGTGHTKNKYAMYATSIPFVVKSEQVSNIYGELYVVNDKTLKQLDRLEGHPTWYCREEIQIITEAKQTINAWLYFYPQATGTLNTTGVY